MSAITAKSTSAMSARDRSSAFPEGSISRSEEHTSELQSRQYLGCRLSFLKDTATTEVYTLSLHDALPIYVGNYGEVYERNVGSGSKLGIPRGLNQLWNAGGLLYSPPIRQSTAAPPLFLLFF